MLIVVLVYKLLGQTLGFFPYAVFHSVVRLHFAPLFHLFKIAMLGVVGKFIVCMSNPTTDLGKHSYFLSLILFNFNSWGTVYLGKYNIQYILRKYFLKKIHCTTVD